MPRTGNSIIDDLIKALETDTTQKIPTPYWILVELLIKEVQSKNEVIINLIPDSV